MADRTDTEFDLRTPRLFVEPDLDLGHRISLTPDQARYLLSVMRLGSDDPVRLFNGRQGEWMGVLAILGRNKTAIDITRPLRSQTDGPDIDYWFAPLKRTRLDYMVQKATELGVARLKPVITQHTVAERVNLERMRANAIEAAEQCGVLRIPEVLPPEPLRQALKAATIVLPVRTLIFCDEGADVRDPIAALRAVQPGPVTVLIGPEGGFHPGERAQLLAMPAIVRLSLGPRIMRADTAAVAALALINATVGDWR